MDILSRYRDASIEDIWNEDNRYNLFYEVELAYLKAEAMLGKIPADIPDYLERNRPSFSAEEIENEEKITRHEVVAFINVVSRKHDKYTEYFHRGLTSSDIMDTVFSLQIKQSLRHINALTDETIKVLTEKADQFKHNACAGRTHGVHAEPYFFGLRFLTVAVALKRSLNMLAALEQSIPGKLSGALGIYTNLDPDIESEFLRILGLSALPVSTQIVPRDVYAPVLFYLALEASILDKLAQDMRILQITEIGEAQEEFKRGQAGSSAMPHKRNPVRWERISGLSRVLRSQVNVALENVPLWFERDISHSSTERIVYPLCFDLIAFMLKETKSLVSNSVFDSSRMLANMSNSKNLLYSSRALSVIQQKLGREAAYKRVQDLSRQVLDGEVDDFIEALRSSCLLSEEELQSITDVSDLHAKVDLIYERAAAFLSN